MFNEESMSH